MANRDHIRNPVEWTADQIRTAASPLGQTGHALRATRRPRRRTAGGPSDQSNRSQDVLAKGVEDFGACRSDVIFLCVIYPLAGLVLAWSSSTTTSCRSCSPWPPASRCVGPVAAVGLYEMSRRREQGAEVNWADAFGVLATPAFGAILVLGLVLLGIFLLWLVTAYTIYHVTMGHEGVVSLGAFYHDVFTTSEGRFLIVVGRRRRASCSRSWC